MVKAIHSKRNRPYLQLLLCLLLISWISLTLSVTCTMPSVPVAMAEMAGCTETVGTEHSHHDHKAIQDCTLKPCYSSQSDTFPEFSRLSNPEMPVFILCLIGLFWSLFLHFPPALILRIPDPPLGRQVLLIYRFCKLLN